MNGAVDLPLGVPELSFTASGDCLVRRSVLPSGVRILTEHVPGSRSATIGYWVAVGSRDELPALAGINGRSAHPATFGSTHFLEHLLFKGTSTRTALDIAVSFDAVGGEHNAMTAKEYTCYYAKVRDRDLPMAVDGAHRHAHLLAARPRGVRERARRHPRRALDGRGRPVRRRERALLRGRARRAPARASHRRQPRPRSRRPPATPSGTTTAPTTGRKTSS